MPTSAGPNSARVKRHHVWALYAFCRHADDIVDDLGPVVADVRAEGAGRLRRPLLRRPRRGPLRRPGAEGASSTPSGPSTSTPTASAGSSARWRWTSPSTSYADLGRPARLHGRVGRGHRRDDAADPRAAEPAALRATPATSATRSSSPTSSATSARTSTAAACTCPRRTSTASAPTPRRAASTTPWRGADALRDRAVPRTLYRSADLRHRDAAAGVGSLHPGGPHALRRDPRPHRGHRLRRLHRSGRRCRPWRKASLAGRMLLRAAGDASLLVLVVAGWLAGTVLLWRVRTPPPAHRQPAWRPRVSVVVPARDEAHNLPRLLASLAAQTVAAARGARRRRRLHRRHRRGRRAAGAPRRAMTARRRRAGWASPGPATRGGAPRTATCSLFLDADTWLAPDGLARLAAVHDARRDGLLSVQPFHRVGAALRAAVGGAATWCRCWPAGHGACPAAAPVGRLRALPAHPAAALRRGRRASQRCGARSSRTPPWRAPTAARGRPVACLAGGDGRVPHVPRGPPVAGGGVEQEPRRGRGRRRRRSRRSVRCSGSPRASPSRWRRSSTRPRSWPSRGSPSRSSSGGCCAGWGRSTG